MQILYYTVKEYRLLINIFNIIYLSYTACNIKINMKTC